mgnify:CR=1 FL=1
MKKFFKIIIAITAIVAIAIGIKAFWNWVNETKKYECEIEEIQDGIYARYQSTVSRAPAYNYEIITVYVNGQLIMKHVHSTWAIEAHLSRYGLSTIRGMRH